MALAPIDDDGLCHITCEAGHKTVVVLEEHRHEWLFETALCAIEDSYFREAVSSFAAALERFYEYAISVYCCASGVDERGYAEAWNLISRQSERQLGAFVAAHTLSERAPPKVLASKKVEFRNDVVHRGKMPNEQEAEAFGDAVLEVILPTLSTLRRKYADAKQEVDNRLRRQKFARLPSGVSGASRISYPMALRDIDANSPPPFPTRHYVERLAHFLRRE